MSNLDQVIDNIIVARVSLLLKHPFFGNLATRLKIVENNDWCKTAATDGRHIYFNREFFGQMSTKQIEFIIAHEILHVVFDHFGRLEGRDKNLFNIATDFCVNGQLIRDKIGEEPKMPGGGKIFHDKKYYGWSAEQVYDDLMENADKYCFDLDQLLDQHIDWGDPDKNDGSRPQYSKEELKQIRDEIRQAILESAQAAGKVPGEIQRLISELTESKMNWRDILRQQIQSIIRNDYSFVRPNRKGWHMSAVLPGTNFDETIDICVSLDMSGSITDRQANDFLSEIKGIMDEYKDFKMKLWCFDTKVYNEQDFDAYNADDIHSYKIMGGGGTDFMANWNYMNHNDITPKKFIMFTDGYPCSSWGDEQYCDTVFIIHGNDTIVPPFGEYAYYEEKKS